MEGAIAGYFSFKMFQKKLGKLQQSFIKTLREVLMLKILGVTLISSIEISRSKVKIKISLLQKLTGKNW